MAKQVFDLGVDAYNRGDYETAAKRFERSWAMDNTFHIAKDAAEIAKNKAAIKALGIPEIIRLHKITVDPNGKYIGLVGAWLVWYDEQEELYKLMVQTKNVKHGAGSEWEVKGKSVFIPETVELF